MFRPVTRREGRQIVRRVRILMLVVAVALMLVPTASVSSQECPAIDGKIFVDFGRPQSQSPVRDWSVHVTYEGERFWVGFVETGFDPVENHHYYDFFFPSGTVSVVEHEEVGLGLVEVLEGGTGSWNWYFKGTERPHRNYWMHGELCLDA